MVARSATIPAGIYYIQNSKLANYMQIDDNDSPNYNTEGAFMELWPLDGEQYQQWEIINLYTGYYLIKSVKSGKLLGVPIYDTNTANVSLTQTASDGVTHWYQWKFELTSRGTYIIRPRSAEAYSTDWCMAASDGVLTPDGRNVEQRAYTNNSDYKDEWRIARIAYASLVEIEGQKTSSWCWAASARMFAKHFYPNISRTQNQAVAYVKNGEVNEGGNREEAHRAIQYYIGNISGASINSVYKDYFIYSETNLKRFLDDGYVVYISRGWYDDINDPNSSDSGHATLIYGYVVIGTEYRFLVRDPWPVNEGETYMMSYEKLCNGRNCQPDETADTGVWRGSVVYNTSYSNNTIPYHFNNP